MQYILLQIKNKQAIKPGTDVSTYLSTGKVTEHASPTL